MDLPESSAELFMGDYEVEVRGRDFSLPGRLRENPHLKTRPSLFCFHDHSNQCLYFLPEDASYQNPNLLAQLAKDGKLLCGHIPVQADGHVKLPKTIVSHIFGCEDFHAHIEGLVSCFSLWSEREWNYVVDDYRHMSDGSRRRRFLHHEAA